MRAKLFLTLLVIAGCGESPQQWQNDDPQFSVFRSYELSDEAQRILPAMVLSGLAPNPGTDPLEDLCGVNFWNYTSTTAQTIGTGVAGNTRLTPEASSYRFFVLATRRTYQEIDSTREFVTRGDFFGFTEKLELTDCGTTSFGAKCYAGFSDVGNVRVADIASGCRD